MQSSDVSGRTPAVSIAIPFYNAGPFFRLALQSVFAQSFADWELLLIDDGGSDGSLELARSLNDPRVRVYSDGQNLRLARRLNQAALLARGKYLFRMDADDIMHPERVMTQMKVLEASPDNTVVGTAAYSIGGNSEIVGFRPVLAGRKRGYAARHSFIHPTVAASTVWFRMNPYSEEDIFSRSEDAELWCRVVEKSDFRWIEEPFYFYREMGVFKLSNYLGTSRGLLELIKRTEPDSSVRLQLTLKERAKMLVATLLNAAGASDMMIRGRFLKMQPQDQQAGNQIVQQLKQVALPRHEASQAGAEG